MDKAHLLLKWGTIKGWDNATQEDIALLEEYHKEPVSMSAIAQRDTDAQKKALLDLIDGWSGTISNDWDGDDYTKEQAKKYVTEYGK